MNKVRIKLEWTDRGYVVADQRVVYKMTPPCEETGYSSNMTVDVKEDCLNAHNEYRARHENTPKMKWSDELAQAAKKWVDKIAAEGKLAHCPQNDRKGQGENIAYAKGKPMTGRTATDNWYSEIKDFDFGTKNYNGKTGHFTQVVWKESVELGAAIATAANGAQFCVARYRVAGNLMGAFDKNIGDLKGQPSKPIQQSSVGKVNAVPTPTPASTPTKDGRATVKEDCLNAHNEYRAKHENTPSMKWSDELAREAKKWVEKIAAECKLAHCPKDDRKGQGENIAFCHGKTMTGRTATDNWYSEIKDFNFGKKQFSSNTGHFTQVVWKESVELGAAIAISANGAQFCVARYRVAGNLSGAFDKNIGDLKGMPGIPRQPSAEAKVPQVAAPASKVPSLQKECLDAHNDYRALHKDTPCMIWSDHLATEAMKWANKIAADETLAHCPSSERKGQGENIACCRGKPMTGKYATDQWYAEVKDFNFGNKTFGNKTGHFTQVVWRESIQLGAAIAVSPSGIHFCVARYSVPGNIKGGFDRNIGDRLSKPQDKQEMEKLRQKIEALQSGLTADGQKPTAQSGDALRQDCLNAHNEYRAKHKDTPKMRWSDELAREAQKWADHLAAVGKLSHCPSSDRKGQGENIACVKGKPMTGRTATDQWYAEIKDFRFNNKVFGNNTGHFTQVVWKESVELGAATATSSKGFHFCVARYRVAGNLAGAFEKNIGDLK